MEEESRRTLNKKPNLDGLLALAEHAEHVLEDADAKFKLAESDRNDAIKLFRSRLEEVQDAVKNNDYDGISNEQRFSLLHLNTLPCHRVPIFTKLEESFSDGAAYVLVARTDEVANPFALQKRYVSANPGLSCIAPPIENDVYLETRLVLGLCTGFYVDTDQNMVGLETGKVVVSGFNRFVNIPSGDWMSEETDIALSSVDMLKVNLVVDAVSEGLHGGNVVEYMHEVRGLRSKESVMLYVGKEVEEFFGKFSRGDRVYQVGIKALENKL